jgi:hypothetical protein
LLGGSRAPMDSMGVGGTSPRAGSIPTRGLSKS